MGVLARKLHLNMADGNCLHSQIGRQSFYGSHRYARVRVPAFARLNRINNELMAKIIDLIIYIFILRN